MEDVKQLATKKIWPMQWVCMVLVGRIVGKRHCWPTKRPTRNDSCYYDVSMTYPRKPCGVLKILLLYVMYLKEDVCGFYERYGPFEGLLGAPNHTS